MPETKDYDKTLLLKMLREMVQIRKFEERAAQAYGLRKIGGFCHLYNGEEAVAVGAVNALDMSRDYIMTGYRDHGFALACGMTAESIMAELYGKKTGCSKGKGGSMHMFDAEKHMMGGNGIVGAQIPIAAGLAMASKYRNDGGVTIVFFGDGAIHQGAFHETLNMARVWNLPVIFVCENNQFGMGTQFERVSSVSDFSIMGQSYGIPGVQADGMNVISMYETFNEAVERARNEHLPTFIEAKTYRYKGHSMSDPAKYRSREDVESYRQQDPILILKDMMLDRKLINEKEFTEIEAEYKNSAENAARFAEESPEPEMSQLYEDILV